jgi:hypothetical protein
MRGNMPTADLLTLATAVASFLPSALRAHSHAHGHGRQYKLNHKAISPLIGCVDRRGCYLISRRADSREPARSTRGSGQAISARPNAR